MFRYDNVSELYDSLIAHLVKIPDTHVQVRKTAIPYKTIIRVPGVTPGLIKSSHKDINYIPICKSGH